MSENEKAIAWAEYWVRKYRVLAARNPWWRQRLDFWERELDRRRQAA